MEIKVDSQDLADLEQRAMQRDMLVNAWRCYLADLVSKEPIRIPMSDMENAPGVLTVDVQNDTLILTLNTGDEDTG